MAGSDPETIERLLCILYQYHLNFIARNSNTQITRYKYHVFGIKCIMSKFLRVLRGRSLIAFPYLKFQGINFISFSINLKGI